ncbi:MAG TPA: hypothetical protein VLG47_03705 [Candidatus Saccharimonadales bacterium]|nr:hypothetical protein [Candidatus Saccharimonadales bacterium]
MNEVLGANSPEISFEDQSDFMRVVVAAAGGTVKREEDARWMAEKYGHIDEDPGQFVNSYDVGAAQYDIPPPVPGISRVGEGEDDPLPYGGTVITAVKNGLFSLIVVTTEPLPDVAGVFRKTQRAFTVEEIEPEYDGGYPKRMSDYVSPSWFVNAGGQEVDAPEGYDAQQMDLPSSKRDAGGVDFAEATKLALLAHESAAQAFGEEGFTMDRLAVAWSILRLVRPDLRVQLDPQYDRLT